jgi:hypothetical protein
MLDVGSNVATARERAVADTYAVALESPGFARLGPELDEDVRFSFPGTDDIHGRSAVLHAHEMLLGAFDRRHFATGRVFRTSGEQTVEWTMTGMQSGDWMGIAATHKGVAVKGLTLIFTNDDGSSTDAHLYFDVAAVKAQLGVGPKDLLASLRGEGDAEATAATQVCEKTGSPEEKGNVAVARAALEALENDSLAAYDAAFADDIEVFTIERAHPWRGKGDTSLLHGDAQGHRPARHHGYGWVGHWAVCRRRVHHRRRAACTHGMDSCSG